MCRATFLSWQGQPQDYWMENTASGVLETVRSDKAQLPSETPERPSARKKRMKEDVERPLCPICNEPIYIVEEAIRHNASGELAHFECILNEIKENNIADMEEEDKIVYLGSGTFGIIQERQNGKNTRFFVRKRINYENRKVKRIEDDADPEEEDLFNV